MLTERKHKVSVLAVDPSSSTSGGECELKFESGFYYLVNYRSMSGPSGGKFGAYNSKI